MTATSFSRINLSAPPLERPEATQRATPSPRSFGDMLAASKRNSQAGTAFAEAGMLGLQRSGSAAPEDAAATCAAAPAASSPTSESLPPASARLPQDAAHHRAVATRVPRSSSQSLLAVPNPAPSNSHSATSDTEQAPMVWREGAAPAGAENDLPASAPTRAPQQARRTALPHQSGNTSSVFVALHDAGETVRVLARLGELDRGERARLKDNIRLLLAAHGVHDADVVVREQPAARHSTSKRD